MVVRKTQRRQAYRGFVASTLLNPACGHNVMPVTLSAPNLHGASVVAGERADNFPDSLLKRSQALDPSLEFTAVCFELTQRLLFLQPLDYQKPASLP
jgi:hypothetical protein